MAWWEATRANYPVDSSVVFSTLLPPALTALLSLCLSRLPQIYLIKDRFFGLVGGDESQLPMDVRLRISVGGILQGREQQVREGSVGKGQGRLGPIKGAGTFQQLRWLTRKQVVNT